MYVTITEQKCCQYLVVVQRIRWMYNDDMRTSRLQELPGVKPQKFAGGLTPPPLLGENMFPGNWAKPVYYPAERALQMTCTARVTSTETDIIHLRSGNQSWTVSEDWLKQIYLCVSLSFVCQHIISILPAVVQPVLTSFTTLQAF